MGGIVKAIGKAIEAVVDVVEKAVDFVVETIETVVEFAVNVVKGVIKGVVGMVEGIITGDWTKFRDSFVSIFQTAVYALGAVVGIATGNPWLIAASVVALDGLHNEGRLTAHIVRTIGKIERELFGSENILENLEIITASIIIVGSLYSGAKGFGLLADASGIGSIVNSQYFQVGMGVYSVADAYMQFQEAQGLYDSLMADYQKWLQGVGQKAEYFNTVWDKVYGEPDILYAASAGGYLFNAGAGSNEYSVSTIHEQSTYLLGIDNQRDIDFDRYFNDPMDIDYPALNIEDTKPEIIRYQV
jgi:hypothetical protein